jgi:hypothetical protein
VSKPKVNQELPNFALFEDGLSESTECVETNFAPPHPFQNGLETISVKGAGPEHFPSLRFKQKTALPVTDVFPQHLPNTRVNVHVTITGISFRCRNDLAFATALLPDVNHRAIERDVFPYFESE